MFNTEAQHSQDTLAFWLFSFCFSTKHLKAKINFKYTQSTVVILEERSAAMLIGPVNAKKKESYFRV